MFLSRWCVLDLESDANTEQMRQLLIKRIHNGTYFVKKLKSFAISYYKNKYTNNFHAFKIENDFGYVSESIEFEFKNNLKVMQILCPMPCVALRRTLYSIEPSSGPAIPPSHKDSFKVNPKTCMNPTIFNPKYLNWKSEMKQKQCYN